MGLTPTLDKLAAQGTLLKQAITPQPTCSAGKVSMLTGKYATEVSVWRGSQPLFDERTLGHYFSEAEIGRAVRTDRWKYAISAPSENGWRAGSGDPDSNVYMERYLYDLHRDPAESVNLIGRHDYQDVADSLRERLRTYLQDVEGADPEIRTFDVPGYHDLAMRANPVRFGYRNQSSGFE
ncbi:sulfatase-like hydrolase/transferase [Halomontanus rarus]|uniref:sulfatase-like hydrolase/transferase n=1 Tax=Halomontanus rarus TaxID=3034020 RepID=UPI003CE48E0E